MASRSTTVAAVFVVALMLGTVMACGRSPDDGHGVSQDDSSRTASVRTEIERTNADFERWYAAGQADSVAARYTTDAWQMGPNMPPVVTRDSIAAFWRRASQMGTWRFTLRTQDVAVNGPVAVERGSYTVTFTPAPTAPAGTPASFTDRGNYVVHWVKENDQWRLKWDIATSQTPAAGPAS
jgi:ketosteroid isomerase-like protein